MIDDSVPPHDEYFQEVKPPLHIVAAIKAIREQTGGTLSLRDTLIYLAGVFGFYSESVDSLTGWYACRVWLYDNRVSLEMVKGPHALTILKAIAAKHDRRNVSTGQ